MYLRPSFVRSSVLQRRLGIFVLLMALSPLDARAQQGWSGEVATLSAPVTAIGFAGTPRVAVDPAGNATAIWIQQDASGSVIQTSRFLAASRTWTPPAVRSAPGVLSAPDIAADAVGNAVAIWGRFDGTYQRVQAARYLAASDTWTDAVDLSSPGRSHHFARVAIDRAGNGIAIWLRELSPTTSVVQTARLVASTGAWTAVRDLATAETFYASIDIAFDADGNAMAVFTLGSILRWQRYDAAKDDWYGGFLPDSGGVISGTPEVAMDQEGNAIAIWVRSTGYIYACRFARALDSWLLPTLISQTGGGVAPKVALNAAGDGQAIWVRTVGNQNQVETMLYSATERTWTGPTVLSSEGSAYPYADVTVDESGNAVAVWSRAYVAPCAMLCLQGARYVAAERMWVLTDELSHPAQSAYYPQVQFDGAGNAVTVWLQTSGGYSAAQSRVWLATPHAPEVTGITAATGTLTIDFSPPASSEAQCAPANYAWSIDNGATWTIRSPASPSSPLVIGGLANGVAYAVRLRAINAAGAGAASAAVAAMPGDGPQSPFGLKTAAVEGHVVTLEWSGPAAGLVPSGYVIEGGSTPGEVMASLSTGSAARRFTFIAPTGTFFVRVHAVADGLRGSPSNEIRLLVNVAAPPSAPAGLLGVVNGSAVSLSWTNTFAGGAPTSLWLSVTGDITTVLPLPMGETFTDANVPPGAYTLAVVAANAAGISPASNTVTLTFPGPCSGTPGTPATVEAWRIGSIIYVSWSPPAGGPAVSSYAVQVGGAFSGSFTTTGRLLWGAAAPGAYTLSVTAANACGAGAPSAPRTVIVP